MSANIEIGAQFGSVKASSVVWPVIQAVLKPASKCSQIEGLVGRIIKVTLVFRVSGDLAQYMGYPVERLLVTRDGTLSVDLLVSEAEWREPPRALCDTLLHRLRGVAAEVERVGKTKWVEDGEALRRSFNTFMSRAEENAQAYFQ